jgi:hypothetical protein
MESPRWVGVGQAARSEPEPGARAAERALLRPDAKLLIVFCSDALDLEAVVHQIRERSGGVPLIGCSTAGEIATGGPGDASVVVTAIGGPGFSVATGLATGAAADLRAAGATAARCMTNTEPRAHQVMLLLTDGLAGDQQEIVRGAYQVLGAGVRLVGGSAGDDLRMQRTFQFHDDQVLTDAVVAAGIASDGPLGIGVRHGWRKTGDPMLVTRSGGNRVYTFDDEPALDVYLERLGLAEHLPDPARIATIAQTHPLGLSRRIGEEQIRFISGGDFEQRSLTCIAEVPQGGLVWIMEGDAASVLAATDAACGESLAALGGKAPLGMLAFDCIARRGVLGDDGIIKEISRVAALAGGAPVAGFYTYGEIARTQGMSGFHNQTLVVLSIG